MKKRINPNVQTGFSLIEISIVMVVVGLLLGGIMAPLSAQFEKSQRNDTRQLMNQALEAVYGFALANGRLPCPDSNNDGLENRTANQCSSATGILPWATLAVKKQDAWGQPLIYRVTANFADSVDGTGCGTPTSNISFSLCSRGNIRILDRAGGNPVAVNVPAVIVSRGKNWSRNTPDEKENTDNDAVFVDKLYSNAAGKEYDDIVHWVVSDILINRMVMAGRLP